MGVDGEVTEFNEAGWLPLVDLADDKVRSAAGAVFLSSTRDLHTIDGLRDVDPGRLPRSRALRKWALDAVSGSVGSKRSLAIDLLAHRLDEHLDSLALTTTEIAAARGDWAASVGDWPVAASAYALLPAGTYRSRIHPVICALNRCWLDPSTRWTLVRWLEAAGDAPEAKLSAHYFKGSLGTARAAKDALEPFSGPRAETAKSACDALAEGRVPCDLGFAAPEVLLLQAIEGKRCPVDWGALRPDLVDEAFVDDLIDSGVITGADRAGLATRLGIDGVYLRARLEPEALTDRDVAALGWDRERERRAGARGAKSGWVAEGAALAVRYLAGDDSAIDQLSTRWPESDVSALRGARAAVHDAAPLLPTGGEPPSGKFIPAAVLAHLWDRLPDSSNWDSQQRGLSSAVGLRRARAALWDADWGSARDWSRGVLRIARDENARDEALNVIACALWQSGDDTGALAALEQALAGEYTINLAINAAHVASQLDPVAAAKHLGKIIREAPTSEMKVAAAKIAVDTWMCHQDEFAEFTGDGDPLPGELADGLRRLVTQHLTLADFRDLIGILSRIDSEWLASPDALRGSPWAASVEAKYFVASATGPIETAHALCQLIATHAELAWLAEEKERFVDAMFRYLLVEDDVPVVGMAALELLDGRLPMSDDVKVPLAAMAAREMALYLARHNDDPTARLADHRVELVVWAAQNVARVSDSLRPDAIGLIRKCADCVQYGLLAGSRAEIKQFLEQASGITTYAQQRQFSEYLRKFTQGWSTDVLRLRQFISQEMVDETDEFLKSLYSLL